MTRPATSIATTSAQTTGSIFPPAPGNGTVSSSLASGTTYSAEFLRRLPLTWDFYLFRLNLRFKRSRTSPTSTNTYDTTLRTRTLTNAPTSSATETVAAAAPPSKPLTPEETAGVAIGSTAGILLAIVAAIFVARRYHAIHAAKRGSGGSSGVYPKEAYLYDPSLGENGGSGTASDEALIFMSGGASGLPSTGSRTPPRVPKNSREYDPRGWLNISAQNYSDPGNPWIDDPFKDPEDPFVDWRGSDAITSPSDNGDALVAGVVDVATQYLQDEAVSRAKGL
ncbi:hypothetical protein J4E93_005564 [Alternaria ventricosa]|uniref:uncharacterized protein n=1 Tax=Alternaria ventricosa TaxID=1187951 RepID=UPI0020C59491|nr:uncharacterized protein J4E93_005564 [Alternaria ventricosa]KAI4645985.1 hypothetical protein J4E93_005564 [Alternaria ventricosa]